MGATSGTTPRPSTTAPPSSAASSPTWLATPPREHGVRSGQRVGDLPVDRRGRDLAEPCVLHTDHGRGPPAARRGSSRSRSPRAEQPDDLRQRRPGRVLPRRVQRRVQVDRPHGWPLQPDPTAPPEARASAATASRPRSIHRTPPASTWGNQRFRATDSGDNLRGHPITSRRGPRDQHAMAFSPAAHVPSAGGHHPAVDRERRRRVVHVGRRQQLGQQERGHRQTCTRRSTSAAGPGTPGTPTAGHQDTGNPAGARHAPATTGTSGTTATGPTVAVDPGTPTTPSAADNGGLHQSPTGQRRPGTDWNSRAEFGLLKSGDPGLVRREQRLGRRVRHHGFGSGPQSCPGARTTGRTSRQWAPVATLPDHPGDRGRPARTRTPCGSACQREVKRNSNARAASPTWPP